MRKYEQIREMARIMNETCNVYDEQGNHIRNKCGECEEWSRDNHCCCSYNSKEAEALYNAGYRKQNEGEWLLIKVPTGVELYGIREVQAYPKCSLCGYMGGVSDWHFKYCPNCGAKMYGWELD